MSGDSTMNNSGLSTAGDDGVESRLSDRGARIPPIRRRRRRRKTNPPGDQINQSRRMSLRVYGPIHDVKSTKPLAHRLGDGRPDSHAENRSRPRASLASSAWTIDASRWSSGGVAKTMGKGLVA